MNTPSSMTGIGVGGSLPESFTADLTAKLAHLAEVTDRLPQPFPLPSQENFAA